MTDRDIADDEQQVDWTSGHYGIGITGDASGWTVLNLMDGGTHRLSDP